MISCWMAFRVRTECGVRKIGGGLCERPTRGILFGCRKDHYWEKVLSWSAHLGVAQLAAKLNLQLTAFEVPEPDGQENPTPQPGNGRHAKRDTAMFYMSVIQTLTAIIGTYLAALSVH
jgi:hypothetical protein